MSPRSGTPEHWPGGMTDPRAVAIPLSGGRFAVPGNRWDLLDGHPGLAVRVAVVIPFYEQHDKLALTLAALEQQTYPHDLIEVVVADDGSAQAPRPNSTLNVSVVSQGRNGFRAAAARMQERFAIGHVTLQASTEAVMPACGGPQSPPSAGRERALIAPSH